MKRQSRGPVQTSLWALNHAQRRCISAGIPPVNRNGGRPHLPRAGQRFLERPIALEQLACVVREELMERSIVRYEHQIILQIESDSVRIGEQCVITLEKPD